MGETNVEQEMVRDFKAFRERNEAARKRIESSGGSLSFNGVREELCRVIAGADRVQTVEEAHAALLNVRRVEREHRDEMRHPRGDSGQSRVEQEGQR